MRLHSDILTQASLRDALPEGIHFDVYSEHGSRSHKFAYEIQLAATDNKPGDKRRRKNSGGYGILDYNVFAARWDEWGVFLASLYRIDPEMKCPYYSDVEDYHDKTFGMFYTDEEFASIHKYGDPWPYVRKGDQFKRRVSEQDGERWPDLYTYEPRI